MVNKDIKQMVLDHVDMRIYFMECDETYECEFLFDKALWNATTPLEHQYVLERSLALLTACGEIELEFAGVNDEGKTLYRRLD